MFVKSKVESSRIELYIEALELIPLLDWVLAGLENPEGDSYLQEPLRLHQPLHLLKTSRLTTPWHL